MVNLLIPLFAEVLVPSVAVAYQLYDASAISLIVKVQASPEWVMVYALLPGFEPLKYSTQPVVLAPFTAIVKAISSVEELSALSVGCNDVGAVGAVLSIVAVVPANAFASAPPFPVTTAVII